MHCRRAKVIMLNRIKRDKKPYRQSYMDTVLNVACGCDRAAQMQVYLPPPRPPEAAAPVWASQATQAHFAPD